MFNIPDNVIHYLLAALVPAGGTFFLFLLKRTFADFESKIGQLFKQLECTLKQQQEHDTRIQLIDQRVSQLEKRKR